MSIEELLEDYHNNNYERLDNPTNIEKLCEEIERLNDIINEALGIANERFNHYYHINERVSHYYHINKKEILEDWEDIFDVLVERDNQELKGSDKE